MRWTAARLAPVRASAIGAETSGHSVSTARKAGGVLPESGVISASARADQASISSRCRIAVRHAVSIPSSHRARRLSRWATGAQPPCPAHGQRRKDCPLALAGRDPRRRDRRFHPVAVLPEARKAPEVKAHAGAGDRVQIGGLRHQVEPTARAIREGLGFIAEVLGVTAVEEGGQVHLRPRPACQPPHRPSDTRQRRRVVLNAGQAQGDPERQPIRADPVAREPAQVGRLDQGEPVPPALRPAPQPIVQRAKPTCDTGEPRCIARLCPPPVVENCGLAGFRPWPGRQIVGLLFDRTGQEPQIVFGCLARPLRHQREDRQNHHARQMLEASYVQNTYYFALYPRVLLGCVCTPYIARARDGLRDLSDRAQPQETKGFLLNSTTESALASVYKRSFIGGI